MIHGAWLDRTQRSMAGCCEPHQIVDANSALKMRRGEGLVRDRSQTHGELLMTAVKLPTAFISYRHAEHDFGPDADLRNRQHRAWVEQFVKDLRHCGVYAIYDGNMR